jgi:hypothetical protein
MWPGLRVAQVRLIFTLPSHLRHPSKPWQLAYVELFTPFRARDPNSKLHSVSRANRRHALIIPLDRITGSCHLIPNYRTKCDRRWTTENVLEECPSFFVSRWLDLRTFYLLQ